MAPGVEHPCLYPGCQTKAEREDIAEHRIAFHGIALAGYYHAGDKSRFSIGGQLSNLCLDDLTRSSLERGDFDHTSELYGKDELRAMRRTDLCKLAATLNIRHTGAGVTKETLIDDIMSYIPPQSVAEILADRACSTRVLKNMGRLLRDRPMAAIRTGAQLEADATRNGVSRRRKEEIERELAKGRWSDDSLRVRVISDLGLTVGATVGPATSDLGGASVSSGERYPCMGQTD